MDAPLHGSLRDAQNLGGFAVGQSFGFDQQKRFVQIGRQGGQGAGKRNVLGDGLFDTWPGLRGVFRDRHRDEARRADGLPPAVQGDLVKPGQDRRPALEPRLSLPCGEEHVLGQVFGVRDASAEPQAEAV